MNPQYFLFLSSLKPYYFFLLVFFRIENTCCERNYSLMGIIQDYYKVK